MKKKSVTQFAIVTGDSAQQFSDTLNAKLVELEGKDVAIDFYENFLGARISWTENLGDKPECLAEEYELVGAGFLCKQCPMYATPLKADGSIDQRTKFGKCMAKDYCKVLGEQRACEKLYQMIQSEEVVLCVAN